MIFRADRCFAVLPLLFLQPVLIHSQISGVDPLNSNRAGINSVTGLIFTPDRVPISRGIMVRLSKGTNDFTAWTDQDGKFIISGVGNGTYTLSVEAGDDFEPTSERLEVAQVRGAPAQTYYVNIQLRWKPDARKKPGVIDSELASAPRKAQEYYRKAVAAAVKGDHQGAIDELLRAVAEYPEFAIAHSELGVEYQKLNQLEKSDEHLRIALKLKPGAYEPLASLGIVLVRMKKHEEAESVLREL
jgi:tetratricopeptide (TPR) repeat protein